MLICRRPPPPGGSCEPGAVELLIGLNGEGRYRIRGSPPWQRSPRGRRGQKGWEVDMRAPALVDGSGGVVMTFRRRTMARPSALRTAAVKRTKPLQLTFFELVIGPARPAGCRRSTALTGLRRGPGVAITSARLDRSPGPAFVADSDRARTPLRRELSSSVAVGRSLDRPGRHLLASVCSVRITMHFTPTSARV
jgi:hypothetical protein